MDKYIKSLIQSKTNVIFCFGDKGVGKTCFITILLKYLYNNHLIEFNSKYNAKGITYILKLLEDLDEGKLPEPTTIGNIEEIDIKFSINGRDAIFTFLDISGEDFIPIKPGTIDPLTREVSKGELSEKINDFLKYKNLNITLLCFIDYLEPHKHDMLNSLFMNYLKSHFDFNFERVAVVVTKWDKNTQNKKLLSFLREQSPQSYYWLDKMTIENNAFKFSIGQVNADDPRKIDSLDLSYCNEIVDWLHNTCEFQTPVAEEEEEEEKTNAAGRIIKIIFGTANPIQEVREWIKLLFK